MSVFILLLIIGGMAAAQPPARYVRFVEAQPILTQFPSAMPRELNALDEPKRGGAWPAWIVQHDREIRARLEQGTEDTVVNWLRFGTSFTSRPRAPLGVVAGEVTAADPTAHREAALIAERLDDLVLALASPGIDSRRIGVRRFIERRGLRLETTGDREKVRNYLRGAVLRVAREQRELNQELRGTSRDDSIAEFLLRSRLFRHRGLSLDTSLLPNYALEQSLAAMKARGLLKAGIKRVGIIGPGLDFSDKDAGFDVYPEQTLQPFALLDSLRRLGASPSRDGPEIVVLDISPRVIDHLAAARARAARGDGYTLHLPLARGKPWIPELRAYWRAFGDRIGEPIDVRASTKMADEAEVRAVRVSPQAVQRVSVVDANVVTQRLWDGTFDLMIATNVFVYYDVLDQALAMANVGAMLKPGGFLLANVMAPEWPARQVRSVDSLATLYTRADGPDDLLDYIVWYQRPVHP